MGISAYFIIVIIGVFLVKCITSLFNKDVIKEKRIYYTGYEAIQSYNSIRRYFNRHPKDITLLDIDVYSEFELFHKNNEVVVLYKKINKDFIPEF